MTTILAIDPGLAKCGAAVLAADGSVLKRLIISTATLSIGVSELLSSYSPARIVMGNGTGSSAIRAEVERLSGEIPVVLLDESHTSEQARARYLSETPARGIFKLLPFLRTPDQPYDDFVAVILGERWLKNNPNSV